MWRLRGHISVILILASLVFNINLGPLASINSLTNTFILPFYSLQN
jgi:hypothetical protein